MDPRASRAPAGRDATTATAAAVKRATGRERDKACRGDKHGSLLARADGTLVVTGALAAPPVARDPVHATRAVRAGEAPGRGSAAERAVALANVRVGGAPGAARVHATLAEGRHHGVELRAVERNGRVAIELVASSAAEARALRAELGGVREALAARGLDAAVTVDVRADLDDRGGGGGGDARDPRSQPDAFTAPTGHAHAARATTAAGSASDDAGAPGDDAIVL